MILKLLLIFQLLVFGLCVDHRFLMKKLHRSESINHLGSTISLRLYDSLQDTLLSSLEIVNVEDIYEGGSKIAQSIHIITYYYDMSGVSSEMYLQPVDKRHNKAFASLISAGDDRAEVRGGSKQVTADHGLQDGVNNKLIDPLINVIARIAGGKLYIRGVLMDYREDITADEMSEDNFEIDIELIVKEPNDIRAESNNMTRFLIAVAVIVLLFLFIVNSDAYATQWTTL